MIFSRLSKIGASPIIGGSTKVDDTSDYTAKSVVLDIINNHGSTRSVGVRSVEFYYNLTLVAIGTFSAYATSTRYATFDPTYTFDPTKSKSGTSLGNEWNAGFDSGDTEDQRLICVFDTPIVFDSIVVNNSHSEGGYTDYGAEFVRIYVSTDAITSTVFDEAISNSIKIFDSSFDKHDSNDWADNQQLVLETGWDNVLDYRGYSWGAYPCDADKTYFFVYTPAITGGVAGDKIRITFHFFGWGSEYTIAKIVIGHLDDAATTAAGKPVYDGNEVEVTSRDTSGITITYYTQVTDEVTFSYDPAKTLMIGLYTEDDLSTPYALVSPSRELWIGSGDQTGTSTPDIAFSSDTTATVGVERIEIEVL